MALRADTNTVQQDVVLVDARLGLAQHRLEAVADRDAGRCTGARVGPVERDPRDRDQSVARRIETARFDVDHDPAVAGRVVRCGGSSEQPTESPAQGHRR